MVAYGLIGSTPRPLFPSSDPLFDYIGPDESGKLKDMVEKDIGISFDYIQCTEVYLDMLEDDSPVQRGRPAYRDVQILPMRKGSFLDHLLGR